MSKDDTPKGKLTQKQQQQQYVLSVERMIQKLVSEIMPWAQGALREDAVALGRYGAMRAALGFKSSVGTRFTTYATPWIAGEIRRFRDREQKWTDLKRRASAAGCAYMAEESDTFEVIDDTPDVQEAKLRGVARRFVTAEVAGVACGPPDPEDAACDAERKRLLGEVIGKMAEGKQHLMRMRYLEERPLPEILEALGISDRTARRWHDEALDELALSARERGLDELI